ncbi:hypothetical protein [Corynebacterium glyciniphilum]|uniref:hypothetical protein n=1 Tax=Corynebacterium glyciniphilum TaxID=1404244 RepID=UPI003FD1767F
MTTSTRTLTLSISVPGTGDPATFATADVLRRLADHFDRVGALPCADGWAVHNDEGDVVGEVAVR